MTTEPWRFELNPFLNATEDRTVLMGEILRDHSPKFTTAAAAHAAFAPFATATAALLAQWEAAESAVVNAEAAQRGATTALVDKLESLTRKPDADTNSPIETWDIAIRATVAYQGPTYIALLPRGRETLTGGTQDENIRALKDFADRLAQQTSKPPLVALGATVLAFYTSVKALDDARESRITAVDAARSALGVLRVRAAWQLFANVGIAMTVWNNEAETSKIGDLFDLSLIRTEAPALPGAPAAPTWDPTTRTLQVAALPETATRLEAWRLHPGGAPERLAVGDKGATSIAIPVAITFDLNTTYQLWITGRNARGTGPDSPHISYTTDSRLKL